jgi:hypothetical protein
MSTIETILKNEIAAYNRGKGWKVQGYLIEDAHQHLYMMVIVPDDDHTEKKPAIALMARLIGQHIIIDEDITDRPLYEALIRAGIPREQLILRYAGEKVPENAF